MYNSTVDDPSDKWILYLSNFISLLRDVLKTKSKSQCCIYSIGSRCLRWCGLLCDVDPSEDLRSLRNTRQALCQRLWRQMVQVQVNVVLLRARLGPLSEAMVSTELETSGSNSVLHPCWENPTTTAEDAEECTCETRAHAPGTIRPPATSKLGCPSHRSDVEEELRLWRGARRPSPGRSGEGKSFDIQRAQCM